MMSCTCSFFPSAMASSVFGNGRTTVNLLPLSFSLSTDILPSISSTSCFTMGSPNPKPSCVAALPNRSKGMNIRSFCPSLMPVPVSSTASVNTPSLYWVVSVMIPLSVNLMALESRLPPMLKIRFLSPSTTSFA